MPYSSFAIVYSFSSPFKFGSEGDADWAVESVSLLTIITQSLWTSKKP